MIEKIRSIQDSWFVKGILILTALSFMSLFGITGYLSSAGKNEPVIKVGGTDVYQDDIYKEYQKNVQMINRMTGENIDENEALRSSLLQGIVQKELSQAIINETARDYNIVIGDDLIKQIIVSQAEFANADGNFNRDKFRRMLQMSNLSEAEYVDMLKQDIIKQHIVQSPVEGINVPKVADELLNKIANQRKTFKYITINPDTLRIDRKISQDELEQYYHDFATQFIEPEARDVSFIVISAENIAKKIVPTNEEIRTYYNDNLEQFIKPEQRNVLQMVFDDEETALKAAEKLKNGADFYKTASEIAGQTKTDTELGLVSKDMLIADMAEEVFGAKINENVGPFKSDMGWHIMKVTQIVPLKETKLENAKAKISETLRNELAYEQASEIMDKIEDEIGAGKALEDIAKEYSVTIQNAKSLKEDGTTSKAPSSFANIVKSTDFIDNAFSYNPDEISQVFETDEGFAMLRVDVVNEAHTKDISEVKNEIEQMWEVNEKAAIAQEIIGDVMHDLENGDSIDEVASRFKLSLKSSSPITRDGSFADLNQYQIAEIFQGNVGDAKVLDLGGKKMIVVATKVVNDQRKLSKEQTDINRFKFQNDFTQQAAGTLIEAYGSDYDTIVEYKNLGLMEQ